MGCSPHRGIVGNDSVGILHSPEHKTRFAADLTKMLPRIPLAEDFWAFSQAGRKLSEIPSNYEDAKPYRVKEHRDVLELKDEKLYVVEKMQCGKVGRFTPCAPSDDESKSGAHGVTRPTSSGVDKTTIQYNSHITPTGIRLAPYEERHRRDMESMKVVNSLPALKERK